MKVLVITQKVNINDSVLGFFSSWLNELAKKIDNIYVLALEKGKVDLVENIELYSLGKENNNYRLNRFLKFNQVLANLCLNKKIDIIFIHMCPEYAILTWPYAKLKNIPIVMWYAHGSVNVCLRLAHHLVNHVVTSSKDGFRINSRKLTIVGQGIDTEKFKVQSSTIQLCPSTNSGLVPSEVEGHSGLMVSEVGPSKFKVNETKRIILSVGRISPIKNYETLIETANVLINHKRIKDVEFQIVGGVPLRRQKKYSIILRDKIKDYRLENYIRLIGPIPYTEIHKYYQKCSLFISTGTGGLDKAVLEAMACGKVAVTCNEAFNDLLKPYSHILMFDKNDPDSLAEKIICILEMGTKDKDALAFNLREIVVRNHNLNRFVDSILAVFKDTIDDR